MPPGSLKSPPKNPVLLPPLKWAGGKRWLIPIIQEFWTAHHPKRLVEPFCGGLSIALGLQPGEALLNDINPHLINFYTQLKKGLNVDIVFRNEKSFFYEKRERFNTLIELGMSQTEEAAQLFYYLNRTCFNGLCRFNRKGFYNVPFGQYKTIHYAKDFLNYAGVLQQWEFSNTDFSQLKIDKNDFIYADPPYDVEFVNYAQDGFFWEDQIRLAEWLQKQKCPTVVSNQATDRILDLYTHHGFDIKILDAPRRISCTGDRTPAKEMLAFKGV